MAKSTGSLLRPVPGVWYLTRAENRPRRPLRERAVTMAEFVVIGAIESVAPQEHANPRLQRGVYALGYILTLAVRQPSVAERFYTTQGSLTRWAKPRRDGRADQERGRSFRPNKAPSW
jgi:hypothetical protein